MGLSEEDIAGDSRFRTVDGVLIVDGLRVWDYDWKPGTVCYRESNVDRPYWTGWFMVLRDDRSSMIMNGERLITRHWSTRESVPDPPRDTRATLKALPPGTTLHAGDGEPVEFDPRVPQEDRDPLPWRGIRTYRRYASDEVTARTPGGKPSDSREG